MTSLNFKGKSAVWNHHLSVPFHTLDEDKKLSLKGDNADENLIIEGDNLLALKALLPKYQGKVKCIYIDPPYNTGNEDWVYSDNVSSPIIMEWLTGEAVGKEGEDLTRHDKWLCMMTPRLKLLRDLMTYDGAIFVSIDDNEMPRLALLMNEIFGEENYIACITVQGNPRARDYGGVARMHDYLLVYGRSEQTELSGLLDPDKQFPFSDKNGGFEIRELRNRNIAFHIGNRPNLYYPFYVNPTDIDENGFHQISLSKKSGWVEVFPKESQGYKTVWRWGKEKSTKNLNEEIVGKSMTDGGYQIVEKYRKKTKMARSIWADKDVNTEKGTLLLKELMGKKVFAYPKPVEMVMRAIEMSSNGDDVVLDSFAGSGTTAHAVMRQNLKDKSNRKFILVEMEDYANSITAERVRRAIKKEGYDAGFTYYKLGPAIDAETMLSGELPTYENFAKYVYYLASGKDHPDTKQIDSKSYLIGKTDRESIYLVYEQDQDKLKSLAITLKWAQDTDKKDKGKKVVYAPACYLDEDTLEKYQIQFVSIPYNLFERKEL